MRATAASTDHQGGSTWLSFFCNGGRIKKTKSFIEELEERGGDISRKYLYRVSGSEP